MAFGKRELAELIHDHAGNIARISRKTGYSRSQVRRDIKKHDLTELSEEVRRTAFDMSEDTLMDKLASGCEETARFVYGHNVRIYNQPKAIEEGHSDEDAKQIFTNEMIGLRATGGTDGGRAAERSDGDGGSAGE